MIRPAAGLGALFALLFPTLLFLALAHLPARLVSAFADPQQLRLSGFSGTLLSGDAARVMLATPAGFLHFGRARWDVSPLSLLAFAPRLALHSEWGPQRIDTEVRLGRDRVTLRALDARIDAGLLRAFIPLELAGRLSLAFDEFVVQRHGVGAADGRLVWQDAAWRAASGVRPLGTYAAEVSSAAPGNLEFRVQTLAGPIQVAGTASLAGERYAVDLEIGLPPGMADPELARALSLIATPRENGYLLRLDGELRR